MIEKTTQHPDVVSSYVTDEDGQRFFDIQIACTRQQFAKNAQLICDAVPREAEIRQYACECCEDEVLRFGTKTKAEARPIIAKIVTALEAQQH